VVKQRLDETAALIRCDVPRQVDDERLPDARQHIMQVTKRHASACDGPGSPGRTTAIVELHAGDGSANSVVLGTEAFGGLA